MDIISGGNKPRNNSSIMFIIITRQGRDDYLNLNQKEKSMNDKNRDEIWDVVWNEVLDVNASFQYQHERSWIR